VPDRMIRERARRSPTLKRLTDAAERAWWRLTVTFDDQGRFDADPEVLLSQLMERKPAGWTVKKMAAVILEWEAPGGDASDPLVHLYQVQGDLRLYGHALTVQEHQRERDSKPKYPEPPCGNLPQHAAKCRDSRQLAAPSVAVAVAVSGAVAGSDAREPQTAAARGAADAAGKGKDNGVDPDIRTWLLATKHLGPLAEDRHADLWATLERAYDKYPWLYFEEEIAKADAWVAANPAKAPRPRGLPAFMRNWMEKAVEIGRRQRG